MTVEIFWVSGSPFSWRALLAAEVKAVPYESHLLSFDKGDHKTPEYRKLNPRGRTPLLRDGDFVLTESAALMVYLDRIGSGPPLFGTTPRAAARVVEALSVIASDFERAAFAFAEPVVFGSASAGDPTPLIKGAAKVRAELAHFEARLAAQDYLTGPTLSAADLAAHTDMALVLRAAGKDIARDLDLQLLPVAERYPHLAAWTKRIEALPGYARVYPPHWREAAG
jgi:glutathione S-transferase